MPPNSFLPEKRRQGPSVPHTKFSLCLPIISLLGRKECGGTDFPAQFKFNDMDLGEGLLDDLVHLKGGFSEDIDLRCT